MFFEYISIKSSPSLNHYYLKKLKFIIPFILATTYCPVVNSASIDALQKELSASKQVIDQQNERLEQIEEILEELEERVGSRAIAHAFDAQDFTIGGFLHAAFTTVDGENGSASSFNRLTFEILSRAQLSDDWSAFMAAAFIRESTYSPFDDDNDGVPAETGERLNPFFDQKVKTPLVIGWANYQHSDAFNVQIGRFITPHGIINMEHFPATLLDTEQPQFLRPFSGDTIFPNFMTGTQVHGRSFMGEHSLQYNAYVSNHAAEPNELLFGGRIAYDLSNLGLTIGLNYTDGQRQQPAPATSGNDYTVTGIDILFKNNHVLWKTEYFSTDEDQAVDREAWYTQPAWIVTPKVIVFYRHDFLDDGTSTGDKTEDVIGINYLPVSNVRLRATLTDKQFDSGGAFVEADATIIQLSGTFSF